MGTGRPVEPFCAPDTQAVPATSRCAHLYFLVKAREETGGGNSAGLRTTNIGDVGKVAL